MHRQKFGEFFVRSLVLELVEGDSSKKETLVSLALLFEPNVYNMVDVDVVWKRKAIGGYLGEWKFSNYDYIIKGKFQGCQVFGKKFLSSKGWFRPQNIINKNRLVC